MAILPVLYRVQEIESSRRALEQAAVAVENNAELTALRLLQKELRENRARFEHDLGKNQSFQQRQNLQIQDYLDRIKQEESKLYSGKTSSSRELDQIQQKIAEYQKIKTKLEDQMLGLLEEDERLTEKLAGVKKQLAGCDGEVAEFEKEAAIKLKQIAFEKDLLDTELTSLVSAIPGEWLERYRKIADSHRGIGIAKVARNSCGACHVGLSDFLLQKIKRGEDCLLYCENCGRILYY